MPSPCIAGVPHAWLPAVPRALCLSCCQERWELSKCRDGCCLSLLLAEVPVPHGAESKPGVCLPSGRGFVSKINGTTLAKLIFGAALWVVVI